MIDAYCGDCDKQVELIERNVYKAYDDDGNLYVNIRCPHCDEYEEIKL